MNQFLVDAFHFVFGLYFQILVSLKVYSAISSNSSSVMASLVDNSMDVISNIILLIVNYKVKQSEPYAYPHGMSITVVISYLLFFDISTIFLYVTLLTSELDFPLLFLLISLLYIASLFF